MGFLKDLSNLMETNLNMIKDEMDILKKEFVKVKDDLYFNLAVLQQLNLFVVFGKLNHYKIEELPSKNDHESIIMINDTEGRRSLIKYQNIDTKEITRIYFLRLDRLHDHLRKESLNILETSDSVLELIKGSNWEIYEIVDQYKDLTEKIFNWVIIKPTVTIKYPDGKSETKRICLKEVSSFIQTLVEEYRLDFIINKGFTKLIHPKEDTVYENSKVSHEDILITYGIDVSFEDKNRYKLKTEDELDDVLDSIEKRINNPLYIVTHYERLLGYLNKLNIVKIKRYTELE